MNFFKNRTARPRKPSAGQWGNPQAIPGTSLIVKGPDARGLYKMTGVTGDTEGIHPAIVKTINSPDTPELDMDGIESMQRAANIESISIVKALPNVF